jgi:hypothetical protein
MPPIFLGDMLRTSNIVPVIGFYIVMILLMLRSDLLYINPYFILFGYRVHRVVINTGNAVVIVSRGGIIREGALLTLREVARSSLYVME